MSLYLLDQKLGSRSQSDASSHKFSLKGRQSGGMHRGHSWVFRAESYDTMLAWYEDIQGLTEKTGIEKAAFVRKHARSLSAGSHAAPSVSSDGVEEDEADKVPYAAHPAALQSQEVADVIEPATPKRPEPGGRFPSDLNLSRDKRDLQSAPRSPSSSGSAVIADADRLDDPEHVQAAGTFLTAEHRRATDEDHVHVRDHQRPTNVASHSGNSESANDNSANNDKNRSSYGFPPPNASSHRTVRALDVAGSAAQSNSKDHTDADLHAAGASSGVPAAATFFNESPQPATTSPTNAAAASLPVSAAHPTMSEAGVEDVRSTNKAGLARNVKGSLGEIHVPGEFPHARTGN